MQHAHPDRAPLDGERCGIALDHHLDRQPRQAVGDAAGSPAVGTRDQRLHRARIDLAEARSGQAPGGVALERAVEPLVGDEGRELGGIAVGEDRVGRLVDHHRRAVARRHLIDRRAVADARRDGLLARIGEDREARVVARHEGEDVPLHVLADLEIGHESLPGPDQEIARLDPELVRERGSRRERGRDGDGRQDGRQKGGDRAGPD